MSDTCVFFLLISTDRVNKKIDLEYIFFHQLKRLNSQTVYLCNYNINLNYPEWYKYK